MDRLMIGYDSSPIILCSEGIRILGAGLSVTPQVGLSCAVKVLKACVYIQVQSQNEEIHYSTEVNKKVITKTALN